ncbi:DUF1127 domain-containing protein [Labrys okinawensis]|uniref:DUF1127 domain-containing protein n=1 Tax=Labrys okinawensis TaxID=346911 RepID=UPI0039BCAEFC
MFERIRHIFDELLAQRERQANIRYFDGLSDRVLSDIGVDRSEIPSLFGSAEAGATGQRGQPSLRVVRGTHYAP